MTAFQWLVLAVFVAIFVFVGWAWIMNRWDEREERRYREAIQRGGPPVLGGAPPRHLAPEQRPKAVTSRRRGSRRPAGR